ncbi:hypothetical protein C2S53_003203 [Perilla frutescens var. hirtella]|uniref:Uncharacterized protein n=1 Tax=Perilla frutescens var. hirtella TaxID=608512 RepID=A0AAD4PDU9_PERFH|nr:hypothetical protein C2S53_003203 [Perilla frutescens var. hirtella]
MSARGGGRASRGSSRASAASPSSSAGLSGGVGGLDLEGSSTGHVVDLVSRRAMRLVPLDVRMRYFEEFKNEFIWDPAITPMISGLWHAKATVRYKDMVHTFKKHRREGRHVCISQDAWDSWPAYWDSPEVAKKAGISSKNRMSEPDGPGTGIVKHKGGSRCAHAHAAVLASENGPTAGQVGWETFMRLHGSSEADYSDHKL